MASAPTTGIVPDNRGAVNTLTGVLTDGTSHTSPVTNSVATDVVDVSGVRNVSIHVVNGASNSVVFTVEGSLDGTNFSTAAYGQGSSGAYIQTAATITASSTTIVYLPPDDVVRYVRVNPSSANSVGTVFTIFGRS